MCVRQMPRHERNFHAKCRKKAEDTFLMRNRYARWKKQVTVLIAISEEGKWAMTWTIILPYLGQDKHQFWSNPHTDLIYEPLRPLSKFSPIKDNHLSLGVFVKGNNENTESTLAFWIASQKVVQKVNPNEVMQKSTISLHEFQVFYNETFHKDTKSCTKTSVFLGSSSQSLVM